MQSGIKAYCINNLNIRSGVNFLLLFQICTPILDAVRKTLLYSV